MKKTAMPRPQICNCTINAGKEKLNTDNQLGEFYLSWDERWTSWIWP